MRRNLRMRLHCSPFVLAVLFVASPSLAMGDKLLEMTSNCMVGGCSGQLCVESVNGDGLVSTCEWLTEYACYRNAECKRQPSGQCGWTQTSALQACLKNPPAADGSNLAY